jgi:hypothetical protein
MGLIVLTALAFYCNGYYTGIWRSRKVFDSLLGELDAKQEQSNEAQDQQFAQLDGFLERAFPGRQTRPESRHGRLPEDFQNN